MAEVTKPTIVARAEFAQNLTELINNAGVPLFVLEPILAEVTAQIRTAVQNGYLQEKTAYERALADAEAEKKKTANNRKKTA